MFSALFRKVPLRIACGRGAQTVCQALCASVNRADDTLECSVSPDETAHDRDALTLLSDQRAELACVSSDALGGAPHSSAFRIVAAMRRLTAAPAPAAEPAPILLLSLTAIDDAHAYLIARALHVARSDIHLATAAAGCELDTSAASTRHFELHAHAPAPPLHTGARNLLAELMM